MSMTRISRLLYLTLLLLAPIPQLHAAEMVRSVDTVGITVSDMDRSLAFYAGVLHFKKMSDTEVCGPELERLTDILGARMRVVQLRLGEDDIELHQYLTPKGRPIPAGSRSNDLWFQHIAIVVSDMNRAYAYLRIHHVQEVSPGPQTLPAWNHNAGGIEALYFRDPDGHNLEILHFPPDKGDSKWQRKTGQLFLGIDHTAIVVADTNASLHLYRDSLGMRVAGESENYGIEQERLNHVAGAHLRITSLRASTGPGIELLEYLAPRTGRSAPVNTQANDLWHWEIHLAVSNPEMAGTVLKRNGGHWISTGLVAMGKIEPGFRKGLMVSDADGHELLFESR